MTHTTEQERAQALAEKHGATSYRNRADTQNPAYGFTPIQIAALIAEVEQAARRAPAVPVPQGWALVPAEVTKEMQDAWDSAPQDEDADDEFYGAYRAMIAAAPQPPEADHIPDAGKMVAAPVQLPEPPFWYCESKTPDAIWPIGRTTKKRESAFKDGYFNQQALYTEQQVRQLLAARGIGSAA